MEVIIGHKEDHLLPGTHRHLPMQSQIALMFMAIMLAFGVFASLLNSWITTNNFEDNLNKKAKRYIQSVFNEHINNQNNLNIEVFNSKLDEISKDNDIDSIGLYDSRGDVVAYKGISSNIPETIFKSNKNNFSEPIINSNIRYYKFNFPHGIDLSDGASPKFRGVSSIILSINDDLVFRTALNAFVWTFLVTMIAAVCTMILAVIAIRRFTNPFNRLSNAMCNAQLGQRGVRVQPGGASEIYKMAESFNAMIAVIERREERLLEQKKTLEKQIGFREKIELELKNITYRLQAIFDNVTDGIVVVDEHCKIVSMNSSANKIYGYRNNEIIGQDLNLIMKAVFIKIAINSLKGKNLGEKLANYETVAICKSGKRVPIEMGISLMDFSGHIHYLITTRDITERKKSDKELNDYRLHLESMVLEQTKDIAESRDAAMAGERAMSAFLANMSHELRTPMHGVLSYANIALKKIDSVSTDKTKEYINEIKTSGNNLLDIINDLLDLSKMKSGRMEYQYSKVYMSNIVNNVTRQMSVLAEKENITLKINILGDEQGFDFDEMRISQVVRNLYANAIKFADFDTEVIIDIDYRTNEKLIFSIFNYGVVVPKAEGETIFNNFIQSSNTKNNAGGTGLGLPICKEIIESGHEGIITVDTDIEEGAKFIVTLPYLSRVESKSCHIKEVRHY